MKQDIGDRIRVAMACETADDRDDKSQQLLRWFVAQIEGSTADWDHGAGERWARVLVGSEVVAFLFTKAPIAIVSDVPETVVAALALRKVSVLRVGHMDSRVLCSDRAAIIELAGRPLSEHFDHEQFSAEDLVWATI